MLPVCYGGYLFQAREQCRRSLVGCEEQQRRLQEAVTCAHETAALQLQQIWQTSFTRAISGGVLQANPLLMLLKWEVR